MNQLKLYKSSNSLKVGDIVLCKLSDFSDIPPGKEDIVFDLEIIEIVFYDKQYHIKTVKGWHRTRSIERGYDTIASHRDDRIIQFPKKFTRTGRSVD